MKSRTRLTIWVVGTAIALSTGIGIFSLYASRASEYAAIDKKFAIVFEEVNASQDQPLAAALYSLQLHNYDFALTVIPQGSDPIEVVGISGNSDAGNRNKSLTLANGDQISLAASTGDIDQSFTQNSHRLIAFIFLLNALYILLGFFYIKSISRRDDRLALAKMQAFIGDASHELRTPLTVIKGYSEMLAAGQFSDGEKRDRAFSRVTSEIKRMENIISDLLLLAELGEERQPVREEFSLSDLVRGHVKDFQTLHSSRSLNVKINDVTVVGDLEHFQRLLSNIFSNISRHTPEGTPVNVSLNSGEKKKLLIEDGGPGLPSELYGEAISTFKRFDKSRSRDKGGSGLGMSIMQAIVAEHKGSITLRKSSLGGLAIEILLP